MRKNMALLTVIPLAVVFVSECIGGKQLGGSTTSFSSHTSSEKPPRTTKTRPGTASATTTPATTTRISNTTTAPTSTAQELPASHQKLELHRNWMESSRSENTRKTSRSGISAFFLKIENDTLMVGMKAPTGEWVAVGFGGNGGMKTLT